MDNVIDELIVKLGLDAKGFEKGTKEAIDSFGKTKKASKKTADSIEQDGVKAEEFYKKLRNGALKFFSVLTVGKGLINFTKDIINSGAQLDIMSNRLGISVDRLSRWTAAIKVNGGTAEGFLGTLKNLSSAMTDLYSGGGNDFAAFLQRVGTGLRNTDGSIKTTEQLLSDIGEGLRARYKDKQDAYNIGSAYIDEATLNVLMQGREAVEKLLASQKPYDEDEAKQARETAKRLAQATMDLERTMMKLVPLFERLVPAFETLVDYLVPAIEKGIDYAGKASNFVGNAGTGGGKTTPGSGWGGMKKFFEWGATGGGKSPNISNDLSGKLSAAEKASGLPPGTLSAIMKQEVGNNQAYIKDPTKYHYEVDKNGKRKSSAFGPFGILDSTASNPGYGVTPLKNKSSLDDQIRFAAQYSAALIKNAGGDVAKGLGRYGEGAAYSSSVLSNMQSYGLSSRASKNNGVSLYVNEAKIYTQATDPAGVVRAFKDGMVRQADTSAR